MRKDGNFITATAEEIDEMLRQEGGSKTDWAAVDALSPEDIERLADEEDGPLPEGWEKTAFTGLPPGLVFEPKQDVHIRLDAAVLRWFKAAGPGYQTRINAVLKAFVAAQEKAEAAPEPGSAR